MNQWKIILASPPKTASTVLSNIIYGLIKPTDPLDVGNTAGDINKDIIVTHQHNLDWWIDKFKDNQIDLYFISSERENTNKYIDNKYYNYPNLVRVQFEELNETDNYSIEDIVNCVYNKVKLILPNTINLNKDTAIKRIKNMNKRYEEIKNKPFSYVDKFYHIHGSHRKNNT